MSNASHAHRSFPLGSDLWPLLPVMYTLLNNQKRKSLLIRELTIAFEALDVKRVAALVQQLYASGTSAHSRAHQAHRVRVARGACHVVAAAAAAVACVACCVCVCS